MLVDVDLDFFAQEIFAGLFASRVSRNGMWRMYVGGGPLMVFGQADIDYENEVDVFDETDSAFGTGLYARGGIEYRLGDGSLLGFGLRAFTADLDFDDEIDDAEFEGVQGLLTYTVGF